MIKVLHIFSGYGGGISSLILNLLENKTEDCSFDLLSFSYQNGELFVERMKNKNVNIYTMPRPRECGMNAFFRFLDSFFEDHHYDAIHSHISGWEGVCFYKSAKKHGVKNYIVHAHGTKADKKINQTPIIHSLNQYINYRCANAFMTCSDMAADFVFGSKYFSRRLNYMIPNGIKYDLYDFELTVNERNKYYAEFNIPEGYKIIGHVGRFNKQKNHEFIISIVKKMKQQKCIFLLVGEGSLFSEIQALAEKEKVSESVRFLGRRNDIPQLMRLFDCMILPSFYEGLPTVAIECQAVGTPILISDRITKQCDMEIGIVKFLPIENSEEWAITLENNPLEKVPQNKALEIVAKRGFTAENAGKLYCKYLKEIIIQ